MSQKVEVVRQVWKAHADHGIEGVLEYFAQDCVAWVCDLRYGKIVRARAFRAKREALEATGNRGA